MAVGMASMPMKASAQFDRGTLETVAGMLLAEKLGIDPQIISGLLGGSGGLGGDSSLFDLAPALALQRQAPSRSIDSIVGLRNQGLGWGAVANRIGVPPSTYGRLHSSGQLDNNSLWRDTVEDELHLSSSTVSRLRSMGFSWRDIVSTTLISRESGRPLSEVANRYRSDRDWSRVANRYGVSRQEIVGRVSSWRSRRSVPTVWTRNSTRWAPPGLVKKGGIPPGQVRRITRKWNRDGQRALILRTKGNGFKSHNGKGHPAVTVTAMERVEERERASRGGPSCRRGVRPPLGTGRSSRPPAGRASSHTSCSGPRPCKSRKSSIR